MKTINRIGLILLLLALLSMSVSALDVESFDLDYKAVQLSSTETIDAFVLTSDSELVVAGIEVVELVFAFDSAQS